MQGDSRNGESIEAEENIAEKKVTKRNVLRATAAAGLAATGVSTASGTAFAAEEVDTIDFGSRYTQNAYINSSYTVTEHKSEYNELEYVDDNGNVVSLRDDGYVLATADSDTPNNPVTLRAADIVTSEYTAFPRGAQYDEDGDGDAGASVSVLDAEHWSLDTSGTAGSIAVTDGDDGTLVVESSSQTSGDTAMATFDLSTVGASDATITSGVARKFLQTVADVNTLEDGVLVEFAVIDSNGAEVTATVDPSGDTSTEQVMFATTGNSKVAQSRVGELESQQSVDLVDIQKLQIRISDANAALDLHAVNLDKESRWNYGDQETTDSDGNVITETLTSPHGSYSITSLSTLGDSFGDADIAGVSYDLEQRAGELADAEIMARVKDADETYDRPKELEVVVEYESATAYDLENGTRSNMEDVVEMASTRYLAVEIATGNAEVETWDDVENISWTSRTDLYDSPGKTVELKSSVAASDRVHFRFRVNLEEDEVDDATSTGGGAAVAVNGGDGGGGFAGLKTVLLGLVAGLGFWKRKAITALFGR